MHLGLLRLSMLDNSRLSPSAWVCVGVLLQVHSLSSQKLSISLKDLSRVFHSALSADAWSLVEQSQTAIGTAQVTF